MFKVFRIFMLIMLLLAVIASAGGYWIYEYRLNTPLPLLNEWHYNLPPKTNLSQVAIDLMERDLMDYPSAFVWVTLARLQNKSSRIKAGEYAIPVGTTPQKLLDILIEGKALQHALTLPEGWTFKQVMAEIRSNHYLIHTLNDLNNAQIMEKLGFSNQHPEGRFYPDTYHFLTGTTDVAFLQRAYRTMETELNVAWEKRKPDIPLNTPYEALILASIIEKETGVPSERPTIAGVFIRRLQKGMLLQTDPTVIYALGDNYDGNIHKQDLKVDSPYNTYRYKGLPPTPIAMPGRDAIVSAVNPAPGDALYFVAKGDGSHYFSNSLSEHECGVITYQLKGKAPERYRAFCNQRKSCAACNS